MVRATLVGLLALAATPAWAVGERIALSKGPEFVDQLHETLCVSMECGTGVDGSIAAKVVKGKAEIKVLSNTGELKATVTAPLNPAGRISSMDLVAATSAIISAIESPAPSKQAAQAKSKKQLAQKGKKKGGLRLAAKSRAPHTRG